MFKKLLDIATPLVLAGAALAGAGTAHAYEVAPVRTVDQQLTAADADRGSVPGAVQSAPSLHTVTVMVTSVTGVDSMDPNSCGEFNRLHLVAQGTWGDPADPDYADPAPVNVVPQGAKLEYWDWKALGSQWIGTFRLCEGSTYSVAQANLAQLAESLESWNGSDLFFMDPVAASNLNRMHTQTLPGRTVHLWGGGTERDPGLGLKDAVVHRALTAPAANTCKNFTLPAYYQTLWGPRTSFLVKGVICTSATPTS